MQYIAPYSILLITLSLMQLLLFDRIAIDPHITPIIFSAFVIVLPMQMNRFLLLLASGLMGVVIDWFSGTAGLCTIMMLAMGYIRPYIMQISITHEARSATTIPSVWSLGWHSMIKYTLFMNILCCALLFFIESLNIDIWLFLTIKSVASGLISTFIAILVSMLFTPFLDITR